MVKEEEQEEGYFGMEVFKLFLVLMRKKKTEYLKVDSKLEERNMIRRIFILIKTVI